jgi:hypothetical protein
MERLARPEEGVQEGAFGLSDVDGDRGWAVGWEGEEGCRCWGSAE